MRGDVEAQRARGGEGDRAALVGGHRVDLDALARAHGGNTIRLTTRQTFQFHWVLREDIRPTIQGLHQVLLDTIAACGDDARGVMASADAADSDINAEVAALAKQLSDHVIPKTHAYHEIWYGEEKVASSADEEPFYGRQYMPRKFKIGFAIPPSNMYTTPPDLPREGPLLTPKANGQGVAQPMPGPSMGGPGGGPGMSMGAPGGMRR